MSVTPAVPIGGYAGWAFLTRTLSAQKAAHAASPEIRRDEEYFRAKIGSVTTAEQLVGDRRLLKVALGAFGLDADINNRYFLRKVLEDGTLKEGALANRLADKRYQAFSRAFGFADLGIPNTQISDFADGILAAYESRSFEAAVGEQDESMRLALNLRRELPAIAARDSSDATLWFTVMGNPPLRQVFETAFGLPRSFGALDLDRQLETMRSRAEAAFGDSALAQFADPARTEALIRRYLLRAQVDAAGAPLTAASGALTLLQAGQASLTTLLRR